VTAAACVLALVALLAPTPEAEQAFAAGQAAVDAGDLTGAEAQFRKAIVLDPTYVRGWIRLATVVSWSDRHLEAVALYERALALEPSNYDARLGLAKVSSWAGEYDKSIAAYESLLKERPEDRTLQLGLASVSSWNNDFDRSIEIYRSLLAVDPTDKEARIGLARVSSWNKDFDTAVREYRKLLQDDPSDRDAALGLARTLSWSGRLRESEAAYRPLLEQDPNDVDARNGMAAILSWQRKLDESLAMYEGTLQIEPDNADALAGRARVLWWLGRRPMAWEALDQAMRGHPGNDALRELSASIRTGLAPVATATAGVMHDSDRNAIDSQTATFTYVPTLRTTAGVSYSRNDATQPDDPNARLSARLFTVSAIGSVRPSDNLLATGSAGIEKIFRRRGSTISHATASAGLSYRLSDAWTFGGSLSRATFAATAQSLNKDIGVTSASAFASWVPFRGFFARFSGERAYLSDDNHRDQLIGTARWATPLKRPKVWLTWTERYYAYDNGNFDVSDPNGSNESNGYFAPDYYWAHVAGVEAADSFTERSGWRVDVSFGTQKVDALFANERTSDTVRGYGLSAWYEIWRGLTIEAYLARTNLALAAGGGLSSSSSGRYKSIENGVRLTWNILGLRIGAYKDRPEGERGGTGANESGRGEEDTR